MTSQYRRVVGDTESAIEDQLTGDDVNISLANSNEVEIHIEKPDGSIITDDTSGAVLIENATDGRVKYDFQSGDLDQQGRYRYEWEVTFADGGILTFPGDTMAKIWVREEIN